MDLQYLTYFRAVAAYENLTKAANELHISQPALSIAINKLEESVGVPLLEHKKGKVKLTACGKFFAEHVDIILTEAMHTESMLHTMTRYYEGRIYVIASITQVFREINEIFMSRYDNARIFQYFVMPKQIAYELINEDADFAVTTDIPSDNRINWNPIFEGNIYAVVSEDHPFANRSEVTLAELKDETIHCYDCGVRMSMLERFFMNEDFYPNIKTVSNQMSHILHALEKQPSVTLMGINDIMTLCDLSKKEFPVLKIKGLNQSLTIQVGCKLDHPLSSLAHHYLVFLNEFFEEYSQHCNSYTEKILGEKSSRFFKVD
ncbi:MAG: LysR family transcriptional regulator [Sphaerochaetaceae bacterium]